MGRKGKDMRERERERERGRMRMGKRTEEFVYACKYVDVSNV